MEKYTPKYHINQYQCYIDYEKALYLPTKKAQLEAIKKILSDPNSNTPINGNYGTLCEIDELPESFLYGEMIKVKKWELEIEIYLENIYNKAKEQGENEINYLIDERYKNHFSVLSDPKENEHFKYEISTYITDKITEHLRNIKPTIDREILDIPTHRLTQKQIALLFKILSDWNIFNKNKVHQDSTKQAIFIASLMGVNIKDKGSNFIKYWQSVQRDNDTKKVITPQNNNAVIQFLQDMNIPEIKTLIDSKL